MPPRARALGIALLTTTSLLTAQNEMVFVGTSVGGTTDPYFVGSSATGTVVHSGGNNFTDNVTDAVWMDQGANLYVSRSLAGNNLSRGVWNGTSITWSTFLPTNNACYGLGADHARKRLWTLTGPSGTTRELVCLDADPASASYGQIITQTTTLTGVSRERWELSQSGNLAVVPHAFLQGAGLFQIVDTNPSSATFLQIIHSVPVPNALGLAQLASACAVTHDDLFAYVIYSGITPANVVAGALAVLFLPTGTLVDFDPATAGQQDFPLPLVGPNRMGMVGNTYSCCVSGQGGTGWAARIDVTPFSSQNTTFNQLQPGLLTSCNAASVSPDGTRMAVTTTAGPALVILDVQSGALIHNIPLPGASNIYTTAWQDLRPTASFANYGTGCGGSLGMPTLTAAAPPRLGTSFSLTAGNAPGSVALFVAGTSDTMSGPFVLPYSLASYGAPGCSLLTAAGITLFQTGAGNSATWSFNVPNNPVHLGSVFFSQAFTLDPPANALGMGTTRGGRAVVGL
jgi:hypothetical protein